MGMAMYIANNKLLAVASACVSTWLEFADGTRERDLRKDVRIGDQDTDTQLTETWRFRVRFKHVRTRLSDAPEDRCTVPMFDL